MKRGLFGGSVWDVPYPTDRMPDLHVLEECMRAEADHSGLFIIHFTARVEQFDLHPLASCDILAAIDAAMASL